LNVSANRTPSATWRARSATTEFINKPIWPAIGCVTRWLGSQWVPTITIRRRDRKVIALGSHASDYELTARVSRIGNLVHGVKALTLCSASLFSWIRRATCQGNCH
jgi:hypothetical protein